VAEAVEQLDCTHVLLLQGDEPLLLPRHVEAMLAAIAADPGGTAWNATGPIDEPSELDRHSFVKCATGPDDRILYCFRRSPGHAPFEAQQRYVRKILGIIAYRRDVLLDIAGRAATPIETAEFIEQMRLIESGMPIRSVSVHPSLPSVNEPHEADLVLEYVQGDAEQSTLLERVVTGPGSNG
jgi:3-deoxy-manno-octulosonate cytidylyltransferase (CMP-KDO synthetase)